MEVPYKYLGLLYQTMAEPQMAAACWERAIAAELEMPLAEECRQLRSRLPIADSG